MIYIGGKADSLEEGRLKAEKVLESGEALEKFREMIVAQGGQGEVIDDYSLFPRHSVQKKILAKGREIIGGALVSYSLV